MHAVCVCSPGPVTCFDPSNDAERNEFYARAARELGVEPSWDENLRWDHLQSKEDALLWTAIQEKIVEHCLSKADTSMMQYVGTAATTRDLVAMADTFDGLGAPINYFGMGHGSLVGSYLLKSTRYTESILYLMSLIILSCSVPGGTKCSAYVTATDIHILTLI